MPLTNAERQKRYRDKLKALARSAADPKADDTASQFIELIKAHYRQGAFSILNQREQLDPDADQNDICVAAAQTVWGELNPTALDLLNAAEQAGQKWAFEKWSRLVDKALARRSARFRASVREEEQKIGRRKSRTT